LNTAELKKLLKGSTAVLILENGEPSFVILGYDAYKGLLDDQEKEIRINHQTRQEIINSSNNGGNGTDGGQRFQSNSALFQRRIGEKEAEMLEKINKQILALKDEIEKEEKGAEISAVD